MRPLSVKQGINVLAMLMLFSTLSTSLHAQKQGKAVLAYYAGSPERLDSFDATQMTHIIYCFGHLEGSRFKIASAKDTLVIQKMVSMKSKNPALKVLLSLGGWGGCETCSDAFFTEEGRTEFAQSVQELTMFFNTDGIDLDWEYPTIRLDNDIDQNPVHKTQPEDRKNFTDLVRQLRKTLGKKATITFAAGGFQTYLDKAVEWKEVMKKADYVNLMSYDLVNGYATITGHHTALYSTPQQKESTDNAVQSLIKKGVNRKKIIIGAAFYSRVWENVSGENNGLYQSGKFKTGIAFRRFPQDLSQDSGFVFHWDSVAKAPYAYHPEKQYFATFDDNRSVAAKTEYVTKQKLGGIMFWELGSDTYTDGLLQTINETLKEKAK